LRRREEDEEEEEEELEDMVFEWWGISWVKLKGV
jgi:hypothetical protein